MDIPSQSESMRDLWEKAIPASTEAALFGGGPEHMIDALERFTAGSVCPGLALLEMPLLGEPVYDVLVGSYGPAIRQAGRLEDASQTAAQAAIDWAKSLDPAKNVVLFLERDGSVEGNQKAGVHCRHHGDLDVMDEFFTALGEPGRAVQYRAVAERLPEGWNAEYAAVFPGRPGSKTRLELSPDDAARERIARDPNHLRACFDAMGFTAYDDALLENAARFVDMSTANTLQFDILPDGTLGGTFSVASLIEGNGAQFGTFFEPGGVVARVCEDYERLGAADGRWRLVEECLQARTRTVLDVTGFQNWLTLLIPNCVKAKWIDGELQPAKFYLLMSVRVQKV